MKKEVWSGVAGLGLVLAVLLLLVLVLLVRLLFGLDLLPRRVQHAAPRGGGSLGGGPGGDKVGELVEGAGAAVDAWGHVEDGDARWLPERDGDGDGALRLRFRGDEAEAAVQDHPRRRRHRGLGGSGLGQRGRAHAGSGEEERERGVGDF